MTCPVAALTTWGEVTGPVIVMTGRVSNVPALTQVTAESIAGVLPGNPIGSVTGNVSGLMTGAGMVAVPENGTVEYFRMSGHTSGIENSTSTSVGLVMLICAPPV